MKNINENSKVFIFCLMILTLVLGSVSVYVIIHNKPEKETKDETEDPYKVIIDRVYQDEKEEEYIEFAESIESLNGIWWGEEINHVKIAYYVNSDSIQYYLDLVERIEKDHDYTGFDIKQTKMEYHATLSYMNDSEEAGNELIKVQLMLGYWQYVDGDCGFGFGCHRTVTMTKEKNILEIEGDGTPDMVYQS